jgi:hypothetical protein
MNVFLAGWTLIATPRDSQRRTVAISGQRRQ